MEFIEVEVEQRRKLGLPPEMMARAGLKPGDRVRMQSRKDGRIVLVPVAELLDKYSGSVPGLSKVSAPAADVAAAADLGVAERPE